MRRTHRPDYVLMLSVIVLLVFGLIMVFSASIVESYSATGSNLNFFWKQVIAAVLGFIAFMVLQKMDYHVWRNFARIAFYISLGLLAIVLIPGIGPGGAVTANRWIDLGFLTLQPSEVIKLTGLLFFASWLDEHVRDIENFSKVTVPFMGWVGAIGVLIMLEPDLGTMIVIAAIFIAQFWAAGAAVRHISLMGGLGLLAGLALVILEPYRFNRLFVFLNPNADPLGIGYQINQALVAVGTGGFLGLGWGHSRQKYNYLPEASSDSIFAVVAEELGFLRLLFFLALVWLIIVRMAGVAKYAPDNFGKLIATGILAWYGFQTLINIGAITGIFPLTGITLPLVSQGGTSIMMMLAAFGILLNISRQTIEEAKAPSFGGWWHSWSHYANAGRRVRARKDRA